MKGKDIGTNLNNFRSKKGLTQLDLAKLLNVTAQTVSNWERGISMPDPNTICQICNILDVSSDELLGLKDEKKDQNPIENSIEKPPVQSTVYYEYTATSAKVFPYLLWISIILSIVGIDKNSSLAFIVSIAFLISYFGMLICILMAKKPRENITFYYLLTVSVVLDVAMYGIMIFLPILYLMNIVVFTILLLATTITFLIFLGLAFEFRDDVNVNNTVTLYIVLIIAGIIIGIFDVGIDLPINLIAIFVMTRAQKNKVYSGSYTARKSYYSKEGRNSESIYIDHEFEKVESKAQKEKKNYLEIVKNNVNTFFDRFNVSKVQLVITFIIIPLFIVLMTGSNNKSETTRFVTIIVFLILPVIFYAIAFFNPKGRLFYQVVGFLAISFASALYYLFLMNGWNKLTIPAYVAYIPYGLNLFAFLIYVWVYPEQKKVKTLIKICLTTLAVAIATILANRTSLYFALGKYTSFPQVSIFLYVPIEMFVITYLTAHKIKRTE